MENIYKDLLESNRVDWQGLSTFTTRKGKEKEILTGIPRQSFWPVYKRNRAAFREAGVTLRTAGQRTEISQKAGLHGGQRARVKKDWELVVWLNRRNRSLFEFQGLVTGANNQPF